MKRLTTLQKTLPKLPALFWDRENKNLEEKKVPVDSFIKDDSLFVTSEDGHSFIDYYGEYRGGYPYIAPALEKWAKDNGGYWEWQNPSAIVFIRY